MSKRNSLQEVTAQNFIRLKKVPMLEEYEMGQKLGRGAFGDILKVRHYKSNQIRCLKIYEKELMKTTNQNQFEEEINIIKTLDHPNIFKIFEFYQDEGHYYLVTEFLEGGELFEYISSRKSMDEAVVFQIMEQIFSAVNYLHKNSIVHRDLKPENLLLAKKNDPSVVKLIDFGTSARFKQGDVFHVPLGTCYYIAPEVIRR